MSTAHDLKMITMPQVARFKAWLDANGITWRDGKGDYQVMQVKLAKGWGAICRDKNMVLSTPPGIREMLKMFKAGKPMPTAAKPAPTESAEYLQDLWDDVALAALPTFLQLAQTEIWNQGMGLTGPTDDAALAAKAAACAADAFMAERAKRVKP
jgi:hypothetical protein